MCRSRRLARGVALVATGGCLLQFVGCATGVIPVAFSYAGTSLVFALFGGLL